MSIDNRVSSRASLESATKSGFKSNEKIASAGTGAYRRTAFRSLAVNTFAKKRDFISFSFWRVSVFEFRAPSGVAERPRMNGEFGEGARRSQKPFNI